MRTLHWLVFGFSKYNLPCPLRLNPRRLDFSFELETELQNRIAMKYPEAKRSRSRADQYAIKKTAD